MSSIRAIEYAEAQKTVPNFKLSYEGALFLNYFLEKHHGHKILQVQFQYVLLPAFVAYCEECRKSSLPFANPVV